MVKEFDENIFIDKINECINSFEKEKEKKKIFMLPPTCIMHAETCIKIVEDINSSLDSSMDIKFVDLFHCPFLVIINW